MDTPSTTEETGIVKTEIEEVKSQPSPSKPKELAQQKSTQDKLIETVFDRGGDMLKMYWEITSDSQKFALERRTEYEKEELKAIDSLDKRDKAFKGVLLIACIVSLGLLAYFEKAQSVAPVLGVIIGLLLKTSSITDFFSGGKGKNYKDIEE